MTEEEANRRANDIYSLATALCLFIGAIIIGVGVAWHHEDEINELKSDAVRYGYGKFVPDEKNNPKFEWIVPLEKK